MKTMRLFSLVLAGLLAACAAEAPAPQAPAPAGSAPAAEGLTEGVMATFEQARAAQEQVLQETAGLIAAGDSASVPELEAALLALNQVIMKGRQAVSPLRAEKTDESRAMMKELREGNVRVTAAYDELVQRHPDPESLADQLLEDNAGQ